MIILWVYACIIYVYIGTCIKAGGGTAKHGTYILYIYKRTKRGYIHWTSR